MKNRTENTFIVAAIIAAAIIAAVPAIMAHVGAGSLRERAALQSCRTAHHDASDRGGDCFYRRAGK